ncbi:DinB family protein [Paenibacillus lutrae]|uniref:DinB family protein n=1 Tax=Paenibacillus lutrae TaxID=2078573 RepID=A0A7X3FES2_9BACL|nr:DinB family protein [Paenibacillus lutrae]MVO98350.1 DinB family protein [Paenibacillus lutrae]
MDQVVFKQIEFVRHLTIQAVEGISENTLVVIPEGFNNNVIWNLGHIYLVQEKFAFYFSGDPLQLPENFDRLFAKGTKPADWNEEAPKLEVLLELLADQPKRIQQTLQSRLGEPIQKPFTLGSGLTFETIGELLNFSLNHEGMHFNTIQLLKRFANNNL